MADIFGPAQRSYIMSRIRGKDTKPEMRIRRMLHSSGYRYRLHVSDLPGKPDIVFHGRRKVIFVHGCFWHRHHCRSGVSLPKTRTDFWASKFIANVSRDKSVRIKLRREGWRVLIVWECELGRDKMHCLEQRLVEFLES